MHPKSILNERQELFCQEYVRRPVGKTAAALAGYEQANSASQASRLLARDDIRARIAQMRAEIARQHCREADAILAKLESIFELALIDHQYGTAVRAVTLQARIAGLLPGYGGPADCIRDAENIVAEHEPSEPETDPMPVDVNGSEQSVDIPAPSEPEMASPAPSVETSPMQGNANKCQGSGKVAITNARQTAVPPTDTKPASVHVNVNQCQPNAVNSLPVRGNTSLYGKARPRRTLSGRRK